MDPIDKIVNRIKMILIRKPIYPFIVIFVVFTLMTRMGVIFAEEKMNGRTQEPEALHSSIRLSQKEINWLKNHQTIRVGGPKSFPPFHFFEKDATQKGMAADYLRLIARRLDINLKVYTNLLWLDVLDKSRKRKIDVIACAARTSEREAYLTFTEPILSFPMVIFSRNDAPFIGGLEDLHGKKTAIIKGISTYDWLKRDGIDIIPYYVNSPIEALETLALGDTDVYIGNLAASSYLIEKNGLLNLKVAAPTPYGNYDLSFAVRSDWPELVSILNKSILGLSPNDHSQIRNKWLSIRFEHGIRKVDIVLWVLGAVGFAGMILGVFVFRNKQLRNEIDARKRAEELLKARASQQAAVSMLGQKALNNVGLYALMNDVVVDIAKTLDVEFAKVMKLLSDGSGLLLLAGVGWQDGLVGNVIIGPGNDTQAGYTLENSTPVIVENLEEETRFHGPQLLLDHEIVSGMSVVIGDRLKPFGILSAHTCKQRTFTSDDIHFLLSIANVLASEIERKSREEAIEVALREKEILLKEIHHRVKNNMQVISSLLSLQANKLEDRQILEAFTEAESRVRSMALVHEILYQSDNISEIDLQKYFERLIWHIVDIFNGQATNIETTIKARGVKLGIDQAISCGLIVTELLTNSFKYAFPQENTGRIKINAEREKNNTIVMTVSDNGIGLPLNFDPSTARTLGLRLVTGLVEEQLEGGWELIKCNGACWKIHWPFY